MYGLLSVAWLEDWEIWVYLNLIVVTRSNPFMFELSSHPSCKKETLKNKFCMTMILQVLWRFLKTTSQVFLD